METEVIRVSENIAKISSHYWDGICKIQKQLSTNPRDHAAIFIQNYAYERSASINGYKKAAIKIINLFFDDIGNNIDREYELYREEFVRELKNYNIKNNAINDIFNKRGNMISIICFLKSIENYDIQIWAKNQLKNGNIKYVHDELKKIRGIGDKISSFYIRDIFRVYELSHPKYHRHLLHPVDVWTEKGAQALFGKDLKKSKVAHFLSEISSKARIRDEDLNAGLCYYGAKICQSAELFQKSLKSPHFIDCVLEIMGK